MVWENYLEMNAIEQLKKNLSKLKVKLSHVNKKHNPKSEFLFKHHFFTLL